MDCGDYFSEEPRDNKGQGVYVICPYCKGKGYCEESELNKETTLDSHNNGFSLPVIGPPKVGSIPSVNKQTLKEKFDYKLPSILPDVSTKKRSKVNSSLTSRRPPASRGKCSDTSDIMADLIGHQEIENPIEFLKVMKAQLVASEWNDRILGIQGAVHLSRIEPDLVIHQGRIISRAILSELGSLRSRCVRIACQATRELFKLSGFVLRPEFDEIVNALLCRAADNNQTIRDEADEALAIIAVYTPVQHVARALTRGPRHKHQLVRKSVLRVYKILVSRIGTVQLMKNPNFHNIRIKVIEAGCVFLDDPISEIRNSSKEMMKPLVKIPEFEDVAQDLSNFKCYQRVENCLFAMKLELDGS